MHNYLLRLSYLGTPFYGWQKQPGKSTVQGCLERCLNQITGESVKVMGAGRTDRGVHALGQACNVHLSSGISAAQLQRGLNALLPNEVRVWSVSEQAPAFDARRDALGKAYLFVIWNDALMSPFLLGRAVFEPQPFDLGQVRAATAHLEGEHDFRAFAKAGLRKGGTVRKLWRAEWLGQPPLVALLLEGNGFLQHMVRCLAGTLLDIGRGRREAAYLIKLLEGAERSAAGPTLPAEGLYLVRVQYPEERPPQPPWDLPLWPIAYHSDDMLPKQDRG
jgi:tRNA pseudouridine38-40 synthase